MIELTDEPRPRPGGKPEPPRTVPSPRTRWATCGGLLLQIPINQKEAGQFVLADQLELVRELRVALCRAAPASVRSGG